MKRINIEKVVVQGFGTFVQPFVFEMDRGGVNIVRGVNGAGKTTLFSALVWCLYQINLKGSLNDAVATWKKERPKDFKGTRVVTTLTVDGEKYAIARHLKFDGKTYGVPGESDLLIFKENAEGELTKGCLVSDVRGKADSQILVDKLIGVDSRTFLNSVMFVQRSKRFIEADAAEKRKLLEELFDLGFVEGMKAKADTKSKELRTELDEQTNERGRIEIRKQGIQERIDDAENVITQWKERQKTALQQLVTEAKGVQDEHDRKENAIRECDATIKELKAECGDTKATKAITTTINTTWQTALDLVSASKAYVNDVNREINRLGEQIKDKELDIKNVKTDCPTCGSALKPMVIADVKKKLGGELTRLRTALDHQKALLVTATQKATDAGTAYELATKRKEKEGNVLQQKLTKYTQAVQQRDIYAADLPGLQQRHTKLTEQIAANKRGDGKPEVDVAGLEKQALELAGTIVELNEGILKLERRLARYDWWRTTGLGSKGLKAYVFSAMLEQLNVFIEKYAERMGLGIRFSVDLTKTSAPFVTECYKDGNVVDYRDLSGGEKQRIDIAMLFAMHDLVSGLVKFNVLIMDEVFEGLDQEGMEQAFDMIRVKGGKETTVYVITHSSRVDTLGCRSIDVVKTDGQSSLQTAA